MLKDEFLKMQRQDIETNKNKMVHALCDCFEEVLKDVPFDIDIDSTKNVEDCLKKMETHARQHAEKGRFAFTPQEAIEFVVDYLGLKNIKQKSDNFVNLGDFL